MRYDGIWRTQWEDLRSWLVEGHVLDRGDTPSVLAGWTVRDLVAHLGRGFATANVIQASNEPPLTLRQYVTGYAGAATEIEAEARTQAGAREADLIAWLDQLAAEAFELVGRIAAPVVRGPRGPITRDDFVLTRLLELVVHGDDLARSVPDVAGTPLVDDAVTAVAAALADGYSEVAAQPPRRVVDLDWIRAATGRVPTDDPHLPLL